VGGRKEVEVEVEVVVTSSSSRASRVPRGMKVER